MAKYQHQDIEQKWQKSWEASGLYTTEDTVSGKENFYQLVEFPYPSGNLHVGHWYAFAVPDIYARFLRMKGKNVLFPIGFDAFGLPAENAAIKHGLNPRDWTYENMGTMETQARSMGASFDWSRKVVTCDPSYYKWTQWLFIQLFNAGLVEQKETQANWCPHCKTVLANEQVIAGHCERCDSVVEKKTMTQWQLGITKYADRLIDDLDALDWPEKIKQSQRNWIGRSEGAEIDFAIAGGQETITVFTTRPDTLFGATYMVLAPEHPLITKLQERITNWDAVATYITATQKKTEIERTAEGKEKTGVCLEGISAVNPANDEEIPIYIADYVLGGYGTGAIMAVPAHDERDFAFAKKYEIPVRHVIEPKFVATSGDSKVDPQKEFVRRESAVAVVRNPKDDTYLCISWKKAKMNGLVTGGIDAGETAAEAALREVREETGYKNMKVLDAPEQVIHSLFYHRMKDVNRWARFAYVFLELADEERETVAVEEDALHEVVWKKKEELADFFTVIEGSYIVEHLDGMRRVSIEEGVLTNSGAFDGMDSSEAKQKITEHVGGRMTRTYKLRDWGVSRQRYWGCPIPLVHCAQCGWQAVPDEQLPVELPDVEDYLPNDDGKSPLSKNEDFVRAECPECGGTATRETDTLDTFVDSSWYFLRYADPKNTEAFADEEQQKRWLPVDLYSGGDEHTTMHLLYSRFFHKALFDLDLVDTAEPYVQRRNRGLIMGPDGNKMSKSKGNVIDPDDIVEKLGADTMRLYLAFIGPFNETGSYPWSPEGIVGVRRFIERVWRLQERVAREGADSAEADVALHKALAIVEKSIAEFKMNTGVAALMSALNDLEKVERLSVEQFKILLQMLAPYAPHITEELWQSVCAETSSIHTTTWPALNEKLLVEDEVELVVQVNGKVRDKMTVPAGQSDDALEALARASEKVRGFIAGNDVKKVIVIKGRLVNIVV